MSIEKRIEELEKSTGVGKQEKVWLPVATEGLDKEQAAAKVKATVAEYRAAHPECSEQDINIITVIDEETKQMVEAVRRGEGTG